MLNLLLPGAAITYNGEEIGQENGQVTFQEGKDPTACRAPVSHFDQISRDFERTPYQWDNTTNGGFNDGETPWLPVNNQYKTINLKSQLHEEKSHYNVYKELVTLRKEVEFRKGDLSIERIARDVIVFSRGFHNQTYYVIFNVGNTKSWTNLNLLDNTSDKLRVVLSSDKSYRKKNDLIKSSGFHLDAHESLVVLTVSSGSTRLISCVLLYLTTISLIVKMVLY